LENSSPLSGTLGRKTGRTGQRKNRELWAALLAILVIGAVYLGVVSTTQDTPAASGLFGHSLGIAGFSLMLMTETLYSIRKRSRKTGLGRLSTWLQFHIFTGLVGPFMVLLHTSWKFNGLAGLLSLLTLVIVVSGFIGRYIYTSIPRTSSGAEIEAGELEREITALEAELTKYQSAKLEGSGKAAQAQRRWLKTLQKRQRELDRQKASLAAARRMLALWHAVHIPIGMVLFTTAFIHIAAAIYYATLLK
jgi:hypothetical protein